MEQLAATADFLVRALSGRRRRRCWIVVGDGRGFTTDLEHVFVPWPLPETLCGRSVTCALALQSSPTKELVASLPANALTANERVGLQLVEGAAAVGWVHATWPGLGDLVCELTCLEPVSAEGLTAEVLMDRALELAAQPRVPRTVPVVLGQLPLRSSRVPRLRATRSILESRLPWSFTRRRRRLSAFSIPVTGPSSVAAPSAGPEHDAHEETAMLARRGAATGIPYPEWNVATGSYRDDHVTVIESRLDVRPDARPRVDGALSAWFEQPLERTWRRRLEDGTDLDVDAIVDDRTDEIARSPHVRRLYQERRPERRNVACAVLVDRSGSLARADVLAYELACADALVAAMEAAGERHAVFTFWSDTRFHVLVEVLRDFDDVHVACPSASGIRPTGHTRIGAAVRHVTARLAAVPARRRVLLVLSDGVPCDEGYEGLYASADVVKAVEEAERSGIAVAVIAIADAPTDHLARLLPRQLRRVRDLTGLPPVLADLHARLVAS